MQENSNRAEWKDARNWYFGPLGIYCSRRDRRLIVPKRQPALGSTINLGHRWGTLLAMTVLGLLVVALGLASAGL